MYGPDSAMSFATPGDGECDPGTAENLVDSVGGAGSAYWYGECVDGYDCYT